tara:strand:- start:176 stop:694 length:519 start_codon:yes stop_codon:yes gene_type:complete
LAPVSWWAAYKTISTERELFRSNSLEQQRGSVLPDQKEEFMNIKEWLRKGEKEDVFLISDIAKHGCRGGVSGLIYYRETRAFHDEHEEEIWDLLAEYAENEGCKLMELVGRIAKNAGSITQLKNDLVWWAVEVRAQELQVEDAVVVGQALKAEKDGLPSDTGAASEPAVKIP